jgi:alpha-acetolactate decarboxylase
MLKRAFLLLLCPLVAFAGGTLTQFGTLSSLVARVYDGAFEGARIAGVKGRVWAGTFDRLNGEMVIRDGASIRFLPMGSKSSSRGQTGSLA